MTSLRPTLCVATLLLATAPAQDPAGPDGYVAHEWGTFTSMVGQDGIALEGLHHEEEALPPFVHDLMSIEDCGRMPALLTAPVAVKFPASRVTQKMETPVIYFHTDRRQRVRVQVSFERGLMTQFFPLPDLVFPPLDEARQHRLDISTIERSGLLWDVELIPRDGTAPPEVPIVERDDPWAIARQVRSAWVRTVPDGSPARVEAEHYLFYRGLGHWQPQLSLRIDADDAVVLHSGLEAAVPFVAVLELGDRGGRFVLGVPIPPGGSQRVDIGGATWQPDRRLLAGQLGDAVHKALVRSGLYDDEARAMVATWSRSWFQADGARAIYLLPRAAVDRVLPLVLDPRPRELVRTLVGRLEFITRASQRRVEQALRQADGADPAGREPGEQLLRELDRFLEPHLRNVAGNGSDVAVRALAERRLAAMAR